MAHVYTAQYIHKPTHTHTHVIYDIYRGGRKIWHIRYKLTPSPCTAYVYINPRPLGVTDRLI